MPNDISKTVRTYYRKWKLTAISGRYYIRTVLQSTKLPRTQASTYKMFCYRINCRRVRLEEKRHELSGNVIRVGSKCGNNIPILIGRKNIY